ncbi:hypothetical protein DPEC_G00343370 [Dallia pectoralis]|uniref:Uncharacterized protein n=1 Tax=Dallia pectoralis TaxID=75939 RepID=A0ACC2F2T6_DALPE|nr:hypothetical protein DPEC_G00343370 [Dallia pectoralis]
MTLGYFFRVFLHCSVLVTGVNCVDAQGYDYHVVQRGKALEEMHIDTGSLLSAPNQLSDSTDPIEDYIMKSTQGSHSAVASRGQTASAHGRPNQTTDQAQFRTTMQFSNS